MFISNERVLSQVKGPVQLTSLSNIANSFLQYCLIRSVFNLLLFYVYISLIIFFFIITIK